MEKGYIYLEKTSCLNLEPSTIIKTSCHFSPLLILGIRNYLLMFNFPEQVHQWILKLWHIKKENALIWVGGGDMGQEPGRTEGRGTETGEERAGSGREIQKGKL